MRQLQEGSVLKVRAVGGLHVVTLSWDFAVGQDAKREGLLGFAIERSETQEWQRGRGAISCRESAIQIQGRGAHTRNAGADLRASGAIISMGRLHRQAWDYLSLHGRACVREAKDA